MQRNRVVLALVLALVCVSFVLVPHPTTVRAASSLVTVNTATDPIPPDGVCAQQGTGTGQSPDGCTLREAINIANAAAVGDTTFIEFQIERNTAGYSIDYPYGAALPLETWTITLTGALPFLAHDNTKIDGFSQERYFAGSQNPFNGPTIIIDGGNLTSNTSGLTIRSSNTTVKGLGIINFSKGSPGIGVDISRGTNNIVQGNYIGVDKTGTIAAPNRIGVRVGDSSATGNLIGGNSTFPAERNIIAGNLEEGVRLENGANNKVQGNYIGLNFTGVFRVSNGGDGVYVYVSDGNVIGTAADATDTVYGNIISGNKLHGVQIQDSSNNQVNGNLIGTNTTGNQALANLLDGVRVESSGGTASGNSIGSNATFARNVISGNGSAGVRIRGTGTNTTNVFNNVIGPSSGGVALTGVFTQTGVVVEEGASRNQIGGGAANQGNIIAGNLGDGVLVTGRAVGSTLFSNDNVVSGNIIGQGLVNNNVLPNKGYGVVVTTNANRTRVGGSGTAGNIIVNEPRAGVVISGTGTVSNTIAGNLIGVRARPSNAILIDNSCGTIAPNQGDGILVMNGPQQTRIGGPTAAEGNIIGGNLGNGISVLTSTIATMQSNQVGTSRDATNPNRYYTCGNTLGGIRVLSTPTITISSNLVMNNAGGDGISLVKTGTGKNMLDSNRVTSNGQNGIVLDTTLGNTISNTVVLTNALNGILISTSNTNVLTNNQVGANKRNGIRVDGQSKDTAILKTSIYTNTQNGILVQGVNTQRVKILDNSITGNSKGIELNPDTVEPTGIPTNPNHDINPPFAIHINQAGKLTGRVLVDRTNASTLAASCITCTLQVFGTNPKTLDGQGRDKLSEFKEVSANGYFTVTLGSVPQQLALTASDVFSNTSEFAVFNATYGLAIGPALSSNAIPGQKINYVHQITNTGTVDFDDLQLGAVSSLGWTTATTPPPPISLAAGATKTVTLTLTLPTGSAPNVVAGSIDQTRLTVNSTSRPTTTASITDTTTVLKRFVLDLSPATRNGSGLPGSATIYQHTLTNNGNLTGTVTLAASTDLGWGTNIDVPSTITLAPGASRNIAISVEVPVGTNAGIQAKTTLDVTVTNPTGETPKQAIDTTTVSTVPRATIIPNREGDAAAGQTIRFEHTVTNLGNGSVTYKLLANSSLGSTFKFTSNTPGITLRPDNTFTVDVEGTGRNVFNFFIDITVDPLAKAGDRDTITISLLDDKGNAVGGASVQDTIRVTRGALDIPKTYLTYLPLISRSQ